mmetsp:Transcript_26077/g.33877  ORF Transcript_26077/g.33877 Transcript_26077/m.33877 type:complete len:134 (+) Transcript_26077:113-514(+)
MTTLFSCIYTIKHICNPSLIYVGSTKNYNSRMANHLYNIKMKKNTKLYRTINEHGIENFKFDIIQTYPNLTKKELRVKENEFIKIFDNTLNTYSAYTSVEEKKEQNRLRFWFLYFFTSQPLSFYLLLMLIYLF